MGCCLLSPAPRTAAIVHKELRVEGVLVKVAFGDLTCEEVDAVINVTDGLLMHRAGVAGALKRAGGLEVTKECEAALKRHGSAAVVVTSAGYMPCKKLLHVAMGAEMDVGVTLRLALDKAEDLHCSSISVSGACAGKHREVVFSVASTIVDWLRRKKSSLREIRLVAWDCQVVQYLEQALHL